MEDETVVMPEREYRAGKILVAPGLLGAILQLPDNARLIGGEWDWTARAFALFIECDDLPPVPLNCWPPTISPILRQVPVGDEGETRLEWDWDLPTDSEAE